VGGGADEFYAGVVGLLMGLAADEGRQERMMDVDNLLRVAGDEIAREHLHVPREDDEVDISFFAAGPIAGLRRLFWFLWLTGCVGRGSGRNRRHVWRRDDC